MNITQIQIAPVDNGFVIQAVSLDGDRHNQKVVATSVEDVRKRLHEFADAFHVPITKPTVGRDVPATATETPVKP